MGSTTIAVSPAQKSKLVTFNSKLEEKAGRDVSQGEAVETAAALALKHVEDCLEGGE